jgi:hypothetical protein
MTHDNDAKIDRWHDGYFAHKRGEPQPVEPDAAAGWQHRADDLDRPAVLMPARPEGYYHAPVGAFD